MLMDSYRNMQLNLILKIKKLHIHVIFYFRPDLFDWNAVASQRSPVQRLDHAFNVARQHLGIEKLLDPEG